MSHENRTRALDVSTPQGVSGALTKESQHVFNYGTDRRDCETSLTMPLRRESYTSTPMLPAFAMNLPEGYLFHHLTQRLAKLGRVDDMKLLEVTGNRQIGRLRFSLPGEEHARPAPQIGLQRLLKEERSKELFEHLLNSYFDAGVAGVQPKVLIPDADRSPVRSLPTERMARTLPTSDLIVKTSEEYPFLAQNEFLCMDAARRAGVDVPEFWLSDSGELFIIKRFDIKEDGQPLGFEDMPVLMGKYRDPSGHYKYQGSYELVSTVIASRCPDVDSLRRYFEYVALSVLVRNGDAHLKNFGLLYEHPDSADPPKLAPLYDVVTTTVYEFANPAGAPVVDREMALRLSKSRRYPTREALFRLASLCHVQRPAEVLDRLIEGMRASMKANKDRVNKAFADKMAREWEGGIRSI
ncbi:MAG: type II toxin-antitoxin system HipA family toxin [Proteobacteria bacterium]|nr:type II toxin-antitoxin system HipA family toxin [Pseudomonadota bacterium]MCL2307842.1 type II toxin-antitoxin system HipA family toxin [Pseudomonadota bacterium]